ncbi:hypothetical protein LguiA_022629 [Lonicera macranthoides]
MGRKPRIDENGIKKGAWSKEEDDKLRAYVERYGHWNWRRLPKFAGLSRCGKSCRLRWLNYLQQNVKRGNYTKEEEDIILKMHEELGNKWSLIAAKLPGRTDNEIKNYWHSHLKKRGTQSSTSCISELTEDNTVTDDVSSQQTSEFKTNEQIKSTQENNVDHVLFEQTPEGYSQSVKSTSDELSTDFDYALSNDINLFSEDNINSFESIGNFWTEPFLVDGFYNQSHFSSTTTSSGFVSPYVSYYGDSIEFFDQVFFQELLENLKPI